MHVANQALRGRLQALQAAPNGMDPLRYLFIVSQAELADSPAGAAEGAAYSASAELDEGGGAVTLGVARADGAKCKRCWNYRCVEVPGEAPSGSQGSAPWVGGLPVLPARCLASPASPPPPHALPPARLPAAPTSAAMPSTRSCASAACPSSTRWASRRPRLWPQSAPERPSEHTILSHKLPQFLLCVHR